MSVQTQFSDQQQTTPKIELKLSALKQTRWYEYLVRFVFGGLLTALTGWITHRYGPVIGGLFLAFPSIFPASVTLVQTHQKQKEEQKGKDERESEDRGIEAAGMTAEGTALGSLGLLAFGVILWQLSTRLSPVLVLLLALVMWIAVGALAWWVHQKVMQRKK